VWLEVIIGQFAQMLLSQGELRYAYYSLVGGFSICASAALLYEYNFSQSDVLLGRLVLYMLLVSLPILIMSKKYLAGVSKKEFHEAA
jgi:hypothetical protein